ncbi:MAG: rare lipoprotein A [Marinobacter excellens HL-55]|uniref:Endolytic peptidoglycan transglycosylase RlpA n=1 Tax=Marinobacter excellens HL-55 TaxID=1305731 RepID=A0A0N8KKI5_9GAMM|nr:MAG: rare lipoprotein A [Marinobacter excellens HL-55]
MVTEKKSGWLILLVALVLSGCGSAPKVSEEDHSSRYTMKQDRAPSGNFDVSDLQDAVPRYEAPKTAGNMSQYQVWGKTYRVMDSNDGYVARGVASWYGEKFHGHKTSNGEVFDMYSMSAAHKSMRIPSYARVTNLDNGQSVIVRVNDRGPFHGDRLIDLSYAAAKKLGYKSRGTAKVEVEAITVRQDGSMTLAGKPFNPGVMPPVVAVSTASTEAQDPALGLFVQLGSFSQRDPAEELLSKARRVVERPMRVRQVNTDAGRFHRAQVGPFDDEAEALNAQNLLQSNGFAQSVVLTDSR